MFRTGYILSRQADAVWFIALPLAAIAAALAAYQWLPVVALASVGLWITVPHHFATWLRTYGLPEDRERWKWPLVIAPLVIFGVTLAGFYWAPMSIALLGIVWDHQHSVMQQHGLARIYDFKARAGAASTARYDLLLNWILYVNLMLTAPSFITLWVRELYRWNLPIQAATIQSLQWFSWTLLAAFSGVYLAHAFLCYRAGLALNPMKYVFLLVSYLLWYYTAWHTDSLLVFGIAHRLMHGLQYIVIVHAYLARKAAGGRAPNWLQVLTQPRNVLAFVGLFAVYAVLYQLLVRNPLEEFGFGVVTFMQAYPAVPELGIAPVSTAGGYDLFASTIILGAPLTHYYLDSFIWKVSDSRTQSGL